MMTAGKKRWTGAIERWLHEMNGDFMNWTVITENNWEIHEIKDGYRRWMMVAANKGWYQETNDDNS